MIEPLVAKWRDEVHLYRKRGQEGLALFLESLIGAPSTTGDGQRHHREPQATSHQLMGVGWPTACLEARQLDSRSTRRARS